MVTFSGNGSRPIAFLFVVEAAIAAGAWIAWYFCGRRSLPHREIFRGLRVRAARFASWQRRRASSAALARGVLRSSKATAGFETDRLERWTDALSIALPRALASAAAWSDTSVVDRAVRTLAGAVESLSMPVRLLQNGRLRTYLLHIALGLIAILGYCLYRAGH